MNFEKSYLQYKVSTENVIQKHAPLKTITVKTGEPKWMDGEFKKARSKRRSLEKRWKRTGKEDDHVKYVSQREHCSKLVISKKEAYYSK